MKIIHEGEPTDQFGRPRENQELGDFIGEINQELQKTNRVLSNIKIDGDVLSEEHESIPCREIDTLEFEVTTLEDLTISSIGELGTYAHRFLDRIPEIIEDWEDTTRDQIETYRDQVTEALEATIKVLTSINELTNIDSEGSGREAMVERGRELRQQLEDADVDDIRTLIEDSAREYFQNLIDTLSSILDQFEERRDRLVERINEIQDVLTDLQDDVKEIIEKAQKQGDSLSDLFNLEKVSQMSDDLTELNSLFNELDQAGKLRTYFPPEQQDQVEETLTELRESVGRLFNLLEEQDPTQVIKVMKKEIEPYLDDAVRMFEELTTESEMSDSVDADGN